MHFFVICHGILSLGVNTRHQTNNRTNIFDNILVFLIKSPNTVSMTVRGGCFYIKIYLFSCEKCVHTNINNLTVRDVIWFHI